MKQPDLGTAIMLLTGACSPRRRWWKFALLLGTGLITLPIAWQQLHDIRRRVMTFLGRERSARHRLPHHPVQDRARLGRSGARVKGTQSQLSFLPEKQTDFVFTMLAEEAGLIGALGLLFLFLVLIGYGLLFALRARSHGRLLAAGIAVTVCCYVVINVAMVTGLIPVVGVPLPLISYGGTAMVTVLIGFGLMPVDIHRDIAIPRFPADAD